MIPGAHQGIVPTKLRGKYVKVAELLVKCLEAEGVDYIFGLPGEENIEVIEALRDSSIRFVLARHEQGASFMADVYGRLSGKAGVCLATLGPGAINLTLGAADAFLDGAPLVALTGQAASDRIYKESHQCLDLVGLFRPITKWGQMILLPDTAPEILRKAFKLAQAERPGATLVVLPEDVAKQTTGKVPLVPLKPELPSPDIGKLRQAADILRRARKPVLLAGNGVCRQRAAQALTSFVEHTGIPVATTFMAKGVLPEDHPLSLGAVGFMRHDYANFAFDQADVILAVGYDLVEYAPKNLNPNGDKQIVHIHAIPGEVDWAYGLAVELVCDISRGLAGLMSALAPECLAKTLAPRTHELLDKELNSGWDTDSFPLKPQRVVGELRSILRPGDIVLCDTGALKMWMARLYRCQKPDTCLFSNGLGTMGYSLPGAIGAKLARPEAKVVAVTGDGAFLMNSQELETAKRLGTPFVVLVWVDNGYGLIKWKQELAFGHNSNVTFANPDFVAYAQSFGIAGYQVEKPGDLARFLKLALDRDELAVIACPVDYSENTKLTEKLAGLSGI